MQRLNIPAGTYVVHLDPAGDANEKPARWARALCIPSHVVLLQYIDQLLEFFPNWCCLARVLCCGTLSPIQKFIFRVRLGKGVEDRTVCIRD